MSSLRQRQTLPLWIGGIFCSVGFGLWGFGVLGFGFGFGAWGFGVWVWGVGFGGAMNCNTNADRKDPTIILKLNTPKWYLWKSFVQLSVPIPADV